MKKINVKLSAGQSYPILIGEGIVFEKGLKGALAVEGASLFVSDRNLERYYKGLLVADLKNIIFPAGEEEKTFLNVEKICRRALSVGLDRSSFLVAFGGGVVGDMTGFAASIYMRGIRYIQVPTTILAMVDSSVGGKTGVDLPEGKNLIGTFWQPFKVLADTFFIKTLPEREIRCGLAEIIKYGVILDSGLFATLEKKIGALLTRDLAVYEPIIARSCRIKASVVEKDERESGLRAILNYGHTFGHAIEKVVGFGKISHGEAVAIGMRMAARFAVLFGIFSREEESRQNNLIDKAGLPVFAEADPNKIFKAMFSDKKVSDGKLRIVVPRAIGKVEILNSPKQELVLAAIRTYCNQ